MHYISRDKLSSFFKLLQSDYDVYVPVKKGKNRFYRRYSPSMKIGESGKQGAQDEVIIGEVRAFEPLKAFYSRARERVAEGFKAEVTLPAQPFCIVGAKACDLKSFKIQDFVFKDHDFEDPFYIHAREKNLVIAADCTFAIDTCFCLALDVKPYPQSDLDLSLAEISGGFVIEAGSKKGERVIEASASLLEGARQEQLAEREEQRQRVTENVKKNIQENRIPAQSKFKEMIQRNYEAGIWREEAATCVECGACNTICPTCHCFLLYDQLSQRRMERLRVWDSCMIKDYARVAAGVNPREWLWMRLRNRFEKKFDFFPMLSGVYACTGCGRCISACPAKIDIRRVLQRLVKDASKQPV